MNSYQTELEGLKRCLASMKEQLPILAIITDRHAQIRVHLQKSEPHIKHFYDCWHLVKGIAKKNLVLSTNFCKSPQTEMLHAAMTIFSAIESPFV